MPSNDTVQVSTRQNLRTFLQPGGGGLSNGLLFAGLGTGYVEITGAKVTLKGGRDAIVVPDPNNAKSFKFAGEMVKAPNFPTMTLKMYETIKGVPIGDVIGNCAFNVLEIKGNCNSLSDHLSGWGPNQNFRIYENVVVLDEDLGDRTPYGDSDTPLVESFTCSLNDVYSSGALAFGEQSFAAALTNILIRDVVYGNAQLCAQCGTPNDGTKLIYACAQASTTSPGAKPNVYYTTDGGASAWQASAVSSAAVAEDLVAIDIVGNQLVVLSKTGGGSSTSAIHVATIGATGAPGSWTKITTGFVGGNPANDIFVASPQEVWFAADGGYIYKSTNLATGVTVANAAAATTENLLRISGNSQVLVATGGGSSNPQILISVNGGRTWAGAASVPVTGTVKVQAIGVITDQRMWIGTSTGRMFETVNQGASWTEYVDTSTTFTSIDDILFVTGAVGYISGQVSGPTGKILATFTGGNSWTATSPRITSLNTYVQGARMAAPTVGRTSQRVSNLAIGGTKTAGTLGFVSLGVAQVF